MRKGQKIGVLLMGMLLLMAGFYGLPLRAFAAAGQSGDAAFANSSMYCWDEALLSPASIDGVITRLQGLQVTDLYADISDFEKYKMSIAQLNSNGIAVYYLTGNKSWYKSPDTLKLEIDKVDAYNKKNPDTPITGIVFDVEPYLDTEYKANVYGGFETYVNNMSLAYSYAKARNIKFVTVIPYWYDNYAKEAAFTGKQRKNAEKLLQKLIKNADRISVMNYYKNHMSKHIDTEVKYAKNYRVEIESIAEFGKPSASAGVEDIVTFYVEDDPIGKAREEWQDVRNTYSYKNLHFSYHHLGIIMELYQDITKYQFLFVDEETGAEYTGNYSILLSNGETLKKRTGSNVKIDVNTSFSIEIENCDIVGVQSEEYVDEVTVQRTYLIHARDVYTLEVYPKLWNGSRYSSVKSGKVRFVNLQTGEWQDAAIIGSSDTGYYTNVKVVSDTEYRVYLLDEKDDVLEGVLHTIKYKDADKVEHMEDGCDGVICLPGGLKAYTCVTMNIL
ncbi:MAG: hypothetical protein IJ833_01545 [Lachnospiraceae bacterium]|nr:hypothetical protein [Lachnospiraceae bacterium]